MQTITRLFSKKTLTATGLMLMAVVFVFGGIAFFSNITVHAQSSGITAHGELHGYAWSALSDGATPPDLGGVGWLSLNCADVTVGTGTACSASNYKVIVTDNVFSGYAWSPNVGWVSFNQASSTGTQEASTCGPSGVIAADGTVTGWARVIADTAATGADGCIDLGTTGHSDGLAYSSSSTVTVSGTTLPGYSLSGYAWGGSSTSWLMFNDATINFTGGTSTVQLDASYSGSLTASPATLTLPSTGGTVHLVWQTSNMTACPVSSASPSDAAWTGTKPLQNPTDWSTATTNTTYPVTLPANTGPTDVTYSYTISCTPSGGGANIPATVNIKVPGGVSPSLDLKVNGVDTPPAYMMPPSTTSSTATLSWTSTGMADGSCSTSVSPAIGSIDNWTTAGGQPTSLSGFTANVPGNAGPSDLLELYTVSCTPSAGGTNYTSSVQLDIPAPATPWCEVTPSSTSNTETPGSAVDVTSPFGVVWHDGPFIPTTVSASSSGPLTVTVGSPGLSTATSTAGVEASGTMPSSSQIITVNASGGGTTCTPATYIVAPTGTTGLPGQHRPAWKEF